MYALATPRSGGGCRLLLQCRSRHFRFCPVLFGGLAQMVGLQLALGVCGALFLLAGVVMLFMPNTEALAQKHSAEDEAARQLEPGIAAGLASRA
jgi:hypothetical protein